MNPSGTRRDRQKAETREIIIETARILFESDGFEKTTMRAVAARAGIGLGTIYKHFANKKEMLAAAMLDDLRQVFESATASVDQDASLKIQFLSLSGHFFAYYTSRPDLIREYLTNFLPMDEQGVGPINEFDEYYAEKVTELVASAQKKGEVDPDRDPGFVSMSMMACYFFVLLNFFIRYKITDKEKLIGILEGLIDQVLP